MPARSARGTLPGRCTVPPTRTVPPSGLQQSDDCVRHGELAAAAGPGEADDLAARDLEGDVAAGGAHGQSLDSEDRLGVRRRGRARVGLLGGLVAGHRRDEITVRDAVDRRGDDMARIAVHRDALAQLEDLLQVVADVEERDALGLQCADPVEEPGDRGGVEAGRRLVQDDEPRAERERAGHFDHLPLLDGQIACRPAYVHVEVPPGKQFARPPAQAAPADRTVALGLPVDEQVLGH